MKKRPWWKIRTKSTEMKMKWAFKWAVWTKTFNYSDDFSLECWERWSHLMQTLLHSNVKFKTRWKDVGYPRMRSLSWYLTKCCEITEHFHWNKNLFKLQRWPWNFRALVLLTLITLQSSGANRFSPKQRKNFRWHVWVPKLKLSLKWFNAFKKEYEKIS